MPAYHLYILQCNFYRIDPALQELSQICTADDIIVLMEDAVFALQHPLIQQFNHIRVLGNAYQLIEQAQPQIATHSLTCIDYDTLSDLIQNSIKTHSWR